MKKRIYVIEWDLYEAQGGTFKYSLNPILHREQECFDKTERDKFIQKYLYLSEKCYMYVDNIQCYVADLEPIEDMQSIIDAV